MSDETMELCAYCANTLTMERYSTTGQETGRGEGGGGGGCDACGRTRGRIVRYPVKDVVAALVASVVSLRQRFP